MGVSRLTLILSLGALLGAREGNPDPKDKRPKADPGATVTVTAETCAVEAVKTPSPVKILTLEQIQASAAPDLSRLLDEVLPGQVVRLGGPGAKSSLFLNGTRSKDTVVTLDGLPMRDTSSSDLNLSTIPLVGVERVEVLTGSCSVLAGADAIGGVVALHSAAPPPEGFHGRWKSALGSQGFQRDGLALSQGFQGGWLRAAGELHQEDAPTETRNPYRQGSAHVGAGLNLGEKHTLALNARQIYVRTPLPYTRSHPTQANTYDPTRESTGRIRIGSLRLAGSIADSWSYEAVLGGDSQHRLEVATERTPASPYDSHRQVFLGAVRHENETWTLALLGQEEQESARMSYWKGGQNLGKATHRSLGAEGSVNPRPWLRAVMSVRHQSDHQDFQPVGLPSHERKASRGVYKAGFNALFENGLRFYISHGTSYGLPSLSSVLYNQGNAANQPELSEEKGRSTLAGTTWVRGVWTYTLDLNRSHYDRLVFFDGNGWFYANGSDIRVQGAEVRAERRTTPLTLGGFLRLQEARDLKAAPGQQLSSLEVTRRPFFSGGLHGRVRRGAWGFEGRWTYTGSYYDVIPYPSVQPSRVHYNDLGAALSCEVDAQLTLSLRGENLLQPRLTKEEWIAKKTDFKNDAYRAYNYPSQAPILSLEARYRF